MHIFAASFWLHAFWHPLHGDGYQFWSGIAGSFLTSLPGWAVALALFLRQRNCHVYRCWRLSWHPHPDHGHPVCRHHHPHDARKLTDGHAGT